MRIALTNPFSWPEVRRGSERFIQDLAEFLTSRGHAVTIVSTHSGPDSRVEEGGITYIRMQQRLRHGFGRCVTMMHAFSAQCYRVLSNLQIDAVHCMTHYDAFAASRAFPKHSSTRIVLNVVGIPTRRYFRSIPHDRFMFERALNRANAIMAPSRCSVASLKNDFGKSALVLPPPVNTRRFHRRDVKNGTGPMFLFVGDVEERRKGAALLMRALPEVRKELPDARIVFSGRAGADRQSQLLALVESQHRAAVTFAGVGAQDDLPQLYSAAAATVLPAIWEAFGLALAESLACGTPVVGCEHGGIPDIITDPAIGRMFSPGSAVGEADNVHGLANALLEAYGLSLVGETPHRCKRRAADFAWDRLGPELEALYCI